MDSRRPFLWPLILAALLVGCALGGCQPQPAYWLEPLATPTPARTTSLDNAFSVYFTAPSSDGFRGGPDRFLAEALDGARIRIDAAVYDLNLWSVRNALIRAQERGVAVRLVVESDSLFRGEIQELIEAGIPVVGDERESLMHHKFVIIDGAEVWTGSMNLTVNGAYRHLNNLVRVRSVRLAENYTAEFEEMFLEGYFGENILANTPYPTFRINDILIENYFSPDDGVEDRILELILGAEESIEFLYYSFTSDPTAEALILQAGRGIEIRGVVDAYQERTGLGGEYRELRNAGLEVYLDVHPEKLHHKVMIIDREIVITGSYNLTRSASEANDENVLIIADPDLAEIYLGEFEWIFSAAAAR